MILPFKCVIEHLVTSKHITCKIKWIKWMFHKKWVCVKVSQSYLTLCDPKDCSPPGSSVHGIFQARRLECVAISSSRGSSWPRDRTSISWVSCIGRWVLYHQGHLGSAWRPRSLKLYHKQEAGDTMREGVCPQEGHHTESCSVSTKACLETFKKWKKRQHLPKGTKIKQKWA